MKQHIFRVFFIFTISFLFFACGSDDDPTGPVQEGSFSLSITGDMTLELNGFAWFWGGIVEGGQGFALWFATDADNIDAGPSLIFIRDGATRPGTGSVAIGNYELDEWNPQHLYAWYSGQNVYLGSKSGSMNVTTSSDNRFAGSFQFAASGWNMDDGELLEVTVSGNFDAVSAQLPQLRF